MLLAAWSKFRKIPPHRNCISFSSRENSTFIVVCSYTKIQNMRSSRFNSKLWEHKPCLFIRERIVRMQHLIIDNWWKIYYGGYTCDNLISKIQVMPCYNEYFNAWTICKEMFFNYNNYSYYQIIISFHW